MSNDLVGYSRAGDVFHYRWAARRCLKMISPNSFLNLITIEGSNEPEKAGEYVIDVTEYYDTIEQKKKIDYYQLKHSTVQQEEPFTISDLKSTFEGFAKRYIQHNQNNFPEQQSISFTIVTNRKIDNTFKQNLIALSKNESVEKRFRETIEKYTTLESNELASFCSIIQFEDSEGDYNVQRNDLKIEIAQLIAGTVDNAQVDTIVALVQERVLPNSDGKITKEDILFRFGFTFEKELYPAPAVWEKLGSVIKREQHEKLKNDILVSSNSIIIHAAGGVGKSVFCRQLVDSLPSTSLGIAYDCFGAGSYRNRSELRHRHRDALVQIVNELSTKGLCDPLLVQSNSSDDDIMRKFLQRISIVIKSLKHTDESAQLIILIDAADNAEMAAKEFNTSCFAHELIRETLPPGCKLVLLCRTERISLLQPTSSVLQLELESFSESETFENLKSHFSTANEQDGKEFYRLTAGNPRVQANSLDAKPDSVRDLLISLGPAGTNVEDQIKLQLSIAVNKIKDLLPDDFHSNIDSICLGLASLPPHIPIDILAKAANVSDEAVKSFVADIGRSLWLYDSSVQFRDEPTETWFRQKFCATKNDYENYIKALEPLASHSSYVSEVLPQLYLQAEQYQKLITIALSDDQLPQDNPVDARGIRVYRLQFAFKAALKLKQYSDAIKLAIRAGEEVSGNQRQSDLLQNNIDLLILFQSKQKIQDIAYKRQLSGQWDGSENIYSASLLSSIKEFQGEARGFLRASNNWLKIYFDEMKKNKDSLHQKNLEKVDILELAYTHFNLFGVEECIYFLEGFNPAWVFSVVQDLIQRFIDIGNFETVNDFLKNCIRNPYYVVAITSKLMQVGRFPNGESIQPCLDLLTFARCRIKNPNYNYNDNERYRIISAIVSFIEACLHENLSSRSILRVLRHYIPERASEMVHSDYQSFDRDIFIRALAIRMFIDGKSKIIIDDILPTNLSKKKNNSENDFDSFNEIVNGLFPWYFLRVQILVNNQNNLLERIKIINTDSHQARTKRYRRYDTLPNEIASIQVSILIFYNKGINSDINSFYDIYLKENGGLGIHERLKLVKASFILPHLFNIRKELEQTTYDFIKSIREDGPEEIANRFLMLARAVLITSPDDAQVYFEDAVNIVSKFGDEIVSRWEAIVSLAKRAAHNGNGSDELAYRFIRCAELVGENVSREKYWNRYDAIRTCTKLSPGIAIAAISRWRDRDVDWFESNFEALLTELIKSKNISSSIAWSLSKFYSQHKHNVLVSTCLEQESSINVKQHILNDAVHILQLEGAEGDYWNDLMEVASSFGLQNNTLNTINYFYQNQKIPKDNESSHTLKGRNDISYNWEEVFEQIPINTYDGLKKVKQKFESNSKNFLYGKNIFWKEVINRIKENELWDFIEAVLLVEDISKYDIKDILDSFPDEWLNKASFKKKWPDLIKRLGYKYAYDLANRYTLNYFIKDLRLDDNLVLLLKEGIFERLAKGYEFTKENLFFDFVSIASSFITSKEASDLIDFSLLRFELHIEKDFGDGQWDNWLKLTNNIDKNISGFIWAALGSPRASMRWNAAHCILKLAELNCISVIDALIEWLEHDKVDSFGSNKFPFYNLHARLYLLIALARVSIQYTDILKKHKEIFVKYALSEPHALIQKIASDIACRIEQSYPDTFNTSILSQIKNVGKSNQSIQKVDYNYTTDSYLHKSDEIDKETKYYSGWDFERYWFEPLGDVFGVDRKQIGELVANIITKDWGVKDENGYNADPRVIIWNRSSNERETWHDHGGYPRADNLDFYLSYHAMFIVAANLITKMPIISKNDWYENEWDEWISRHLPTRADGKWLADTRDPIPLNRPNWVFQNNDKIWKLQPNEKDFLACLIQEENGETWMNVKGGWHEKHNDCSENYSISTALVSRATSKSLLYALSNCKDPYDYKLPDYEEDRVEIDADLFNLKGWIKTYSKSNRLDEFDLYANDISYPPYSIGESIKDKLNLAVDEEGKIWTSSISTNPSLVCEIWNSYIDDTYKVPTQSGKRLKASLSFLKYLCYTLKCDLILEVEIKRDVSYRHNEAKREYRKPAHKIYILSEDGKLRNRKTSYQLR
jgi:hypothetical protein